LLSARSPLPVARTPSLDAHRPELVTINFNTVFGLIYT
jgi:hypothetical protein